MIGKSPNNSEVSKLIEELNLSNVITFRSGISEKEIVDLYHSSELAVIPSLYEGFGFGAGEAMACGVPLISTHSGGLEEVVGDARAAGRAVVAPLRSRGRRAVAPRRDVGAAGSKR